MAVLGKGTAHGACSLLHAAALGYGACMALDLPITVRLLDRPSKREVVDTDNVLGCLLDAWKEADHPLPEGFQEDELHWGVNSKIPPKQGLKSSAAACIAGVRALCDATSTVLEPHEMVFLAAQAQLAAGVSLTGSIDDAWGCMTPGWKLVDVQAPIAEGIHAKTERELLLQKLVTDGVLTIGREPNPARLAIKLESFLTPSARHNENRTLEDLQIDLGQMRA